MILKEGHVIHLHPLNFIWGTENEGRGDKFS